MSSEQRVSPHSGARGRGSRAAVATGVAGAMTVALALTGPVDAASAAPTTKKAPRAKSSLGARLLSSNRPTAAPANIPATYRVAAGDTVAGVALRFGLSTASLLAINGLGWKSLIFPGQTLRLSSPTGVSTPSTAPIPVAADRDVEYTIQRGDTITMLAHRFSVTPQSILSANSLGWSSIIYPGQEIIVPSAGRPNLTLVASVTPAAPAVMSPAPSAPAAAASPVASAAAAPAVALAAASNSASNSATVPTTPTAPTTNYVIRSGDTVASIARAFGIDTAQLLAANGLRSSGVIFAGRTLVVPAAVGSPSTAQSGSTVTPLSPEMAANARTIIQVGRQLEVPDRGIVIALAAAMQESGLRNLSYGDRDSVGLFQQRPSVGWGSRSALTDPTHAARLFYGGASNPNHLATPGLLDITGWQTMSLTKAAQAVQKSSEPLAYARWETSADAWLSQLS